MSEKPTYFSVQTLTVTQSESYSTAFANPGKALAGIWIPTCAGSQMYVLSSYATDAASADFLRTQKLDGTGVYVAAVETGSKYFSFPDAGFTAPAGRLEFETLQQSTVYPIVITKR